MQFTINQKGHNINTYIDDIIGYSLCSQANSTSNTFHSLLEELRITISKAKLVPPSTKVTCLGIQIDTPHYPYPQTNSLKSRILARNGTKCKKRELQSLLGSLLYISKCVRVARTFLNRMFIFVINSGKIKDMILAALAGNINMESARADIHLNTVHILGKHNHVADTLSSLIDP